MVHQHPSNHGTLKSYLIGFILSIFLTIVPYIIVVNHTLGIGTMIVSVVAIGIIQLLVQLIFFLHLNTSKEGQSHLLSFVFTFLIIAILVVGSLWIMYNMNINMMPH